MPAPPTFPPNDIEPLLVATILTTPFVPVVIAAEVETLPFAAILTVLAVAFKALATLTEAALELRLIRPAVIVPPEFVRLPDAVSVTFPMFPLEAARLPLTFKLPLAFSTKLELLPAEDAFNVTAAAVSLPMLTLPVALSAKVAAFRVLLPVYVIPAEPLFKLVLAELRVPLPVIPETAPLAVNVKAEPDELFNIITALFVSATFTAPRLLIVRLEAFIELGTLNVTPAVPAVKAVVADFNNPADVIPESAPAALNTKDVPEEAFKLILPALLSTMFTAPVEFAASVVACAKPVLLTVIPPVPELIDNKGAERTELEVTAPLVEEALSEIDVVPSTDEDRVTLPVELSAIVPAEIVPAVFVRLPDEESVAVPFPALRLPLTLRAPLLTPRLKFEPEEAFNETAAAVSLAILTLPAELSDSVEAFSVLAPA